MARLKFLLLCWCKKCGRILKAKREYIKQGDTCDRCFQRGKEMTKCRCYIGYRCPNH